MTNIEEIWKDIPGFEGYYQASTKGRIKNAISGRILTVKNPNSNNYVNKQLTIKKVHRTFQVHRLVAITFIPNPENKPQVNHINSIRTDNRVENLEWCTAKENLHHASVNDRLIKGSQCYSSKLDDDKVSEIKKLIPDNSAKSIAKKYGVHVCTIHKIKSGKLWRQIKI